MGSLQERLRLGQSAPKFSVPNGIKKLTGIWANNVTIADQAYTGVFHFQGKVSLGRSNKMVPNGRKMPVDWALITYR